MVTKHAKLYGMYPQKGAITIGSDTNLALWAPTRLSPSRRIFLIRAGIVHSMRIVPRRIFLPPATPSGVCG